MAAHVHFLDLFALSFYFELFLLAHIDCFRRRGEVGLFGAWVSLIFALTVLITGFLVHTKLKQGLEGLGRTCRLLSGLLRALSSGVCGLGSLYGLSIEVLGRAWLVFGKKV